MIGRNAGLAALAVALLATTAAATPVACTGDCDGNGRVTVDEIVVGLSIALGQLPVGSCLNFDADGSGTVTVEEIVAAVSNALNGCAPPVPTPIFPADYRDSYSEVRDCRFSIEHGGVSVRVFANPVGAQPYLGDNNPLPVGTIVVKEEFSGPTCDDGEIIRRRVMRKEAPGFDPDHGDWRWQWVETDGTVTFNDKTTCIGCHVRPECRARDFMCTEGDEADTKLDPVLTRLRRLCCRSPARRTTTSTPLVPTPATVSDRWCCTTTAAPGDG